MSEFILGVEEIAIAVHDAQKAAFDFSALFGVDFNYQWELPDEKIFVKSSKIGNIQLQFIESTSKDSVVEKFLKKRGEGLNHLALKVKNLDLLMERLRKNNVKLVPEKPIVVKNIPPYNKSIRYIFVHPASFHGVLIELIEEL